MHPVLSRTLGGLSPQYYFRQLFFAVLVATAIFWLAHNSSQTFPWNFLLFALVSTLLYPYSRFVFESVVGFIQGDNVIFGSLPFMLVVKSATIVFCWLFALFVAPIGLLYLYYRHSRKEAQQ